MDACEATQRVMSRIQALDPENVSKIMGFILIQDESDKELLRLAFGPDSLLQNVMNHAKKVLELSSNNNSGNNLAAVSQPLPPPLPSSPVLRQPGGVLSPRVVIPNNGFCNPSSPTWSSSVSGFSPRPPSPLSYAAVVNGGSPSLRPSFNQEQLSIFDEPKNSDFLDQIMSPSGRSDSMLFGEPLSPLHHRRSFSVSDVFEEAGGWRPCMYYQKGFCKNGSACNFVHDGGFSDCPDGLVGSPSKVEALEDLIRLKAIQQQQQRLAAAMAASGGVPFPPNNRCFNFLSDSQRSAASALMLGDEFPKFGRCIPNRNEFAEMSNSSSRQIYLTFPADSTFKEEDVSNYFSMFGPVQDVRIPYQQKRMFGFVTFVFPETVQQILAKGNPHFVCESRVLVKPYKEKGKVSDKKQMQHQFERGDFPGCLSPTALDSLEPFDHIPFGARMFNNNQEMLRRKLEERQALEIQERKIMNLHLSELKNHLHNHPSLPSQLLGVRNPSPSQYHSQMHNFLFPSDGIDNENVPGDLDGNQDAVDPVVDGTDARLPTDVDEANSVSNGSGGNGHASSKEESVNREDNNVPVGLENVLPESPFASPTKSAAEQKSVLSSGTTEAETSIRVKVPPNTSTSCKTSQQSSYFQMPDEAFDM